MIGEGEPSPQFLSPCSCLEFLSSLSSVTDWAVKCQEKAFSPQGWFGSLFHDGGRSLTYTLPCFSTVCVSWSGQVLQTEMLWLARHSMRHLV